MGGWVGGLSFHAYFQSFIYLCISYLLSSHPPTHPPFQHLIQTASSSPPFPSTTHPPTFSP